METISHELNKSKARYKSLLNSVTNYNYTVKVKNGNAISTHHSPSCEAVTGYTIEEYEADPNLWYKMIYNDDRNLVLNQVNSLLKGEVVDYIEHRLCHKNGNILWIRHKLVPLYDEKRNVIEYDGLIENIHERKIAEEALKLSELKYRKIFEHTQDIYYRVDTNGTIIDVSPSIKKYLGFTGNEIIGNNIEMLYKNPADRKKLVDLVIEEGEITDYEITLKSKTEELIITSVNSHVILNAEGIILGIEGSLRDITERKRSEEKIKKLNQAVEQSPAGIIITDVEGIIEYVNPRFSFVSGYSAEEIIGKKSRVFKAEKLLPGEFKQLWMTITKGTPWKGEYYNRKKNGEPFWESILISPILNEFGEVINFLIITEDITEKKKFVKELIEAKEKAEKSDRFKSQFLAQMSHEIRTPINSIINFTEILKEELPANSSPPKGCYDAIDVSCKRIIRTIDMILQMSEIQTGTYNCSYKLINLFDDVIDKLAVEFRDKAAKKNLQFIFNKPSQNIFILGDQYSLENIFSNLLDNAIIYTFEGRIELHGFVNNNNNPCISVIDTGIGVSEDFLSDIFKPFIQEDQGYTRRYDGNGLGLALAKSYCEINDADISVESKKGKGSKFTVRFNQTI